MSNPTRINELRKEIESFCGNCDRPDKEQLGKIILSSMALGFSYGMEADRLQGQWIDFKNGWKCSACGKWNNETSNFCPNCGASMRERGGE